MRPQKVIDRLLDEWRAALTPETVSLATVPHHASPGEEVPTISAEDVTSVLRGREGAKQRRKFGGFKSPPGRF